MLGAITGDIIGSRFEWNNHKSKEFPLFSPECHFTDDSILTIALAESILRKRPYDEVMREYVQRYPNAGYGGSFHRWANDPGAGPYNSWGNGAAMRTSPVGYAFDRPKDIMKYAERYASYTHNHPEGIKGAQTISTCIFMALNGATKEEIRENISTQFGYDLNRTVDEIRPDYTFDVSCQGSVPEAIICFIESIDFEDAIRNAISIGGDSDTLACITGSIAEAFYTGVPEEIWEQAKGYLDQDLLAVVDEFHDKCML